MISSESWGSISSGAKALIDVAGFMYGQKPVPFDKRSNSIS